MANEDFLLRSMPHSLEGEQAVLGSMLIDPDCVGEVMRKLRPDDFHLRQNREIFETISAMFVSGAPIDGLTVAGEMERNGTCDEHTTRSYLAQLIEITPTSANVMEYAKIVAEKSALRSLARAAARQSMRRSSRTMVNRSRRSSRKARGTRGRSPLLRKCRTNHAARM